MIPSVTAADDWITGAYRFSNVASAALAYVVTCDEYALREMTLARETYDEFNRAWPPLMELTQTDEVIERFRFSVAKEYAAWKHPGGRQTRVSMLREMVSGLQEEAMRLRERELDLMHCDESMVVEHVVSVSRDFVPLFRSDLQIPISVRILVKQVVASLRCKRKLKS